MGKKHIFFNLADKPANMGQSQSTDDITAFLKERSDILPNVKAEANKITFDIATGDEEKPIRRGYAIVTDVPDDFQN